jgi:hypothetical protein
MDTEYGRAGQGFETLVPATLIGFRRWYVDMPTPQEIAEYGMNDSPVLKGMLGHLWPNAEIEAVCHPPAHSGEAGHSEPVPHTPCTCGVYATYYPDTYDMSGTYSYVGAIEASGRVVCGSKGFRAGRARLMGLYIGGEPDHSLIYQAKEFAEALKDAMDAVGLVPPADYLAAAEDEDMARYEWLRIYMLKEQPGYGDIQVHTNWGEFVGTYKQQDLSALGIEVER